MRQSRLLSVASAWRAAAGVRLVAAPPQAPHAPCGGWRKVDRCGRAGGASALMGWGSAAPLIQSARAKSSRTKTRGRPAAAAAAGKRASSAAARNPLYSSEDAAELAVDDVDGGGALQAEEAEGIRSELNSQLAAEVGDEAEEVRGAAAEEDADDGEGDDEDLVEEGIVGGGLPAAARLPRAPAADDEAPAPPADDTLASKYITDTFPDLAAEYEAAGAANAVPVEDVMMDSAAVAAWQCPRCSNTWHCGVFVRCVLKTDCPTCSAARHPTVAEKRPELVPLWDTAKNDPFLTPESCPADSSKTVHWMCPTCSQGFTARVKDRVANKTQCPACALMHMQSSDVFAQEESALLQEWHPLKNGDLRLDHLQPTDAKTKVWWLCCRCGHDWQASLAARLSRRRRSKGSVCPACQGQAATDI